MRRPLTVTDWIFLSVTVVVFATGFTLMLTLGRN